MWEECDCLMRVRIWTGGVLVCCMAFVMLIVNWNSDKQALLIPQVTPIEESKTIDTEGTSDQQSFVASVREEAFDYNQISADEGVNIRLDSDPMLLGNYVSTLIPKRDETITFFFKEPMNRSSVEQALLTKNSKDDSRFYPQLLMHWSSDRQLHVKALIVQTKAELYHSFNLITFGALTQKGVKLTSGSFTGTIGELNQLWKVSSDGSQKKQLTSFQVPYWIEALGQSDTTFLLIRSLGYCQCDRESAKFTTVYDAANQTQTAYPVDIQIVQSYRGSGSFVADRRGFFYELSSKNAIDFPKRESAVTFNLPYYIHGASFSKDGRSLILLTGKEDQTHDFTMRIVPLDPKQGQETVIQTKLQGKLHENEANGHILPLTFNDDGKKVYFTLRGENGIEVRYVYDWKKGSVESWNPPIDPMNWAGFQTSSDGRFRIYANGGLYDGDLPLKNSFIGWHEGFWIPNTHEFVANNLSKINAETLIVIPNEKVKLPTESMLLKVSKDAKWYYMSTSGQIK
ncbi:hypothetical protein [Paenibacillus sp. KN14-4R]|uniref:hypothetical protein n=1 Tax=Paenibacillus sp. KN14-4R TaxID=3445773 RepID=UPI003F9F2988